jgi:hypothetical protein
VKQPATASRELQQRSENDATFLPSIIIRGKIWVNGCNPDKKKVITMGEINTYTKGKQIGSKTS